MIRIKRIMIRIMVIMIRIITLGGCNLKVTINLKGSKFHGSKKVKEEYIYNDTKITVNKSK